MTYNTETTYKLVGESESANTYYIKGKLTPKRISDYLKGIYEEMLNSMAKEDDVSFSTVVVIYHTNEDFYVVYYVRYDKQNIFNIQKTYKLSEDDRNVTIFH